MNGRTRAPMCERPTRGVFVAVLTVALFVSACSDATPHHDAGITVDTYCDAFSGALREGYEACCDYPADALDEYIEFVRQDCENGEISSVRAGNSVLDSEVAEACIEAYRRDFEDCIHDVPLGAECRYRWYGFAGEGESCRDVWYCERGLGCVGTPPDGVCTVLPVDGESCGETAECAPGGIYCSFEDWTCHQDPNIGEPCEREGICTAGECIDGTCQAYSFCR